MTNLIVFIKDLDIITNIYSLTIISTIVNTSKAQLEIIIENKYIINKTNIININNIGIKYIVLIQRIMIIL